MPVAGAEIHSAHQMNRKIHIHWPPIAGLRRSYADNLQSTPTDRQRRTYHSRIGIKMTSPKSLTENRDEGATYFVFIFCKRTSQEKRTSRDIEHVSRNESPIDSFCRPSADNDHIVGWKGGELLENVLCHPDILIIS